MICVSLNNKTLDEIYSILDDPFVEIAEVRLDLCPLTDPEIQELVESCEKPLIISFPPSEKSGWTMIFQKLKTAIEAGVDFVDLDLSAPVQISKDIQALCGENGTRLIRSFHDFNKTPDIIFLTHTILRCFRYGADIAKIACHAGSIQDADRLISLYDTLPKEYPDIKQHQLILISMGEVGSENRVRILEKGAPFSYAYYDKPSAPGQLDMEKMHTRVYGDWRGVHKHDFKAPCSKSFAQRAIIAAALAKGKSTLSGFGSCKDTQSAIETAKSIGAKVYKKADKLIIEGIGPIKNNTLNFKEINVDESGLLCRLMIPLSAVLSQNEVKITGKGTLINRPLKDANDIMAAFGVLLQNENQEKNIHVPLRIKGSLVPGTAEISGKGGSQLISGLLMSLPLCEKDTTLLINEPKSIPYLFITQDITTKFGIKLACEMEGDAEMLEEQDWNYCHGIRFKIKGNQQYKAAELELEGDWSAAAAFLCYGALFGEAEVTGLNTSSVQADISILDVLSDAGACIAYDDNTISVKRAPLEAFEYNLNNAPDIIPLACLLAAFCPGESVIEGANRLNNKECDRAQAIIQTLQKMGIPCRITGDEIHVEGMSLSQRFTSGNLLKGGQYSSFHDHRMVMLLSIAQMGADSPIEIDDTKCVSKSFPGFFEEMEL